MAIFVYVAAEKTKPNERFVFAWRDDISETKEEAIKKASESMPESNFVTGPAPYPGQLPFDINQ